MPLATHSHHIFHAHHHILKVHSRATSSAEFVLAKHTLPIDSSMSNRRSAWNTQPMGSCDTEVSAALSAGWLLWERNHITTHPKIHPVRLELSAQNSTCFPDQRFYTSKENAALWCPITKKTIISYKCSQQSVYWYIMKYSNKLFKLIVKRN